MKKIFLMSAYLVFIFLSMYADDGTIREIQVNGESVMICSLDKVKNKETIPLSQLVESCTLIQLDDKDEALFKPWFTTVTDKYIGVRQQGQAAYKLFDRKGKFLCDVGRVGQGPGEYSISIYDDIIDDKNGLIYLVPMTGKKILIYNTSGKFLKDIEFPHSINKGKIQLSVDETLSVIHMPFANQKIAFQVDKNGKIIKDLNASPIFKIESYDGEIFNTRNTSAFEFLHTSSDTLYHYDTKRNKIVPIYSIEVKGNDKPFRQYMELNNRYLTMTFGKGLISTDKKTKNSSYVTVVNDFYGGLEMPVNIVTIRNGYYVLNLEPGQLIERIEKRMTEGSCTDKDKQVLKKLLSGLDENANNILFVGKLK